MIFFDIDDTLVTHSQAQAQAARLFWETFTDRLPYSQQEFPAVWDAVMQTHFAAFAAGEISFGEHRRRRVQEIFAATLSDDEADGLFQVYLRHYEDCWNLFDDVLPCLDALRSQQLGIISNGNGWQQRRKLERLGIANRFSIIVISEEVGIWKPKPEIFREACRQADTAPHECAYVGDSLTTDAEASRSAGMRGVWLNRHSQPGTDVHSLRSLSDLATFLKLETKMTRSVPKLFCLTVLAATLLPLVAHADGRLDWNGDVDDQASVSIHGREVRTQTVSGKSVSNVNTQEFGRLPDDRAVFVNVTKHGRGTVRVVQQPGPFNNYTAVVQIHDPQPGASHYRFRLEW